MWNPGVNFKVNTNITNMILALLNNNFPSINRCTFDIISIGNGSDIANRPDCSKFTNDIQFYSPSILLDGEYYITILMSSDITLIIFLFMCGLVGQCNFITKSMITCYNMFTSIWMRPDTHILYLF